MSLLGKAVSLGTTALLSAAVLVGASAANAAAPTLPPGATTLGNVKTETSLGLLQDDFSEIGKNLADRGIYLSASYVFQLLSNVSGGMQTATYIPNELTLGVTLDLQKMLGLTGASLHVVIDKRSNNDLAPTVGEGINIGINPVFRQVQLSEFYWQQAIDHDRLDIIFGRSNPTLFFATSALSCAFPSHLICAQPEIWYNVTGGSTPFPFSQWGGRVKFQATKDIYVQVGGYQDDPNQIAPGYNGFSWRWDQGDGVFIPAEIGYQTKTAKYDVGFYHDTAMLPGTHTGFWVQGQQLVWKALPRTLTLLAGALVTTGDTPTPQNGMYYAAGFLTAPLLSRPHDTLGLIIADTPLNSSLNGAHYSNSLAIEADYGFEVMPGATVSPVVEYIVNPSSATHKVDNAWILGAQLYINLTQILKFPVFVPHD